MSAAEDWDGLVDRNARDEYGETWRPSTHHDHPATLVGVVVGYNLGPDFGYGRNWVATIADREGKLWSVWLSHAVLQGEFERTKPMPEERIVIRYKGRSEAPTDRGRAPAHLYRVTVDREPELPEFLTAPPAGELEAPRSDIPSDMGAFEQTAYTDADVVEEKGEDDGDAPF
jgi:hypothetical protein